ncbi:MAG TPA: glycosyltransferase [Anaerolineales bacterium]
MANRPVWLLRLFVFIGILAFGFYLSWWFQDDRLNSPWLVALLFFAILYAMMQIVGNWLLYLFAYRSSQAAPQILNRPSVDVFVTAFHEPHPLIERTLAAACAMYGEHKTWLLDDGADPALARLAQRLGAGYLARQEHPFAKAGNLNAALKQTQGEVVVIFDIDHVPHPDFLERSLGHFNDPQVGFVQVMLTFENDEESWVSQAAIETSLEFYNPTSMGADGLSAATLMGSNALIRRKTLQSIGGYQPGLAEDLATSIAIHAKGWKSVYVAEPLAPGLAPPSFGAWFTQQLKWARGVFELLLTAYPRLFPRLNWGQRLSYAVRMTKYWLGPIIAAHLFATIAILSLAGPEVRLAFHQYLIYITPLALADVAIRHIALRVYHHPDLGKTSLFKAVALVYGTWPIYTLAWGMALLRLPLGFRPTPKDRSGKLHPTWLLPQIIALVLIVAGIAYTVFVIGHPLSILLFFAAIQAFLQLLFLGQWLYATPSWLNQTHPRIHPGGPVAVWDVDFENPLNQFPGRDRYRQAFCLVRFKGQPVGQVILDLLQGSVSPQDLQNRILAQIDMAFWEQWIQDALNWQPAADAAPLPSVTVAVCTRDRPQDLRSCLQALMRQADLGQQVVVIDSFSATDETRRVVDDFPGVRYVREEYPGLNRARNRACHETTAEVLAFVDDDAEPDPGWLGALLRNFHNPRVACVTGLTMPLELETKAQQWFEWYSSFGRGFSRKVFDKDNVHPLAAGDVGAGVNMAFRREIWSQVGLFDEALDAGTQTFSGGDTEMFSRILAAGYQIAYDPAALSWHKHRKDWTSLRRTISGYGTGVYAFWTRRLFTEGEWGVIPIALDWLLRFQLPGLARALLQMGWPIPLDLLLSELYGCAAGPGAYYAARRELKRRMRNGYQPYQWLSTN